MGIFFFFSYIWYIVDEIYCNISNIAGIVYRHIIIIVAQISSQYRIVSYPYRPTPTNYRYVLYITPLQKTQTIPLKG